MEDSKYPPGDFSFVKVESEREMLADAYKTITELDLWDFMRTNPGRAGFVYSRNPKVLKIFINLKIKSHSVLSLMVVMKNMAKIATEGWEAYVDSWKQEELETEAEKTAEETKTPENSVEEESSPENSVIAEHTGISE
jgi:hypothetical protein